MKVKSEKLKAKSTLANFLFEAATLKRLQRTGWQILGDNQESIAEHSFMVCVISFALSELMGANLEKVLLIALFHDFSESRSGDIYKLADYYVTINTAKANKDAFVSIPLLRRLVVLTDEYEKEQSLEAKIVHDADTLALMVELKQLIERGNLHAREWFEANFHSLRIEQSQKLAKELRKTDSQEWWNLERLRIHKDMINR